MSGHRKDRISAHVRPGRKSHSQPEVPWHPPIPPVPPGHLDPVVQIAQGLAGSLRRLYLMGNTFSGPLDCRMLTNVLEASSS
jgi:hypothetical protein